MLNIEKTAENQGFHDFTNEEIVEKIRSGEDTDGALMQTLYDRNLPLIRKLIRPFTASGEPMEDLEQEAFFGLQKAIERYESSENVLFMSYASYWIRNSVQRYVQKCGSLLRLPDAVFFKVGKYRKAVTTYETENGEEPTGEEVANMLQLTVVDLDRIKTLASGISSLDTPIAETDGEITLADTVQADVNIEESVVDDLYAEQTKTRLWGIVEDYTDAKQNEVLRDYFLNGISMADIARRRGCTLQYVREIREKGLQKLRMGKARRRLLEDFEVSMDGIYRGGFNSYNDRYFTSTTEYVAIKRTEIRDAYNVRVQNINKTFEERQAAIQGEMDAKRKEVEERCAVRRRNVN